MHKVEPSLPTTGEDTINSPIACPYVITSSATPVSVPTLPPLATPLPIIPSLASSCPVSPLPAFPVSAVSKTVLTTPVPTSSSSVLPSPAQNIPTTAAYVVSGNTSQNFLSPVIQRSIVPTGAVEPEAEKPWARLDLTQPPPAIPGRSLESTMTSNDTVKASCLNVDSPVFVPGANLDRDMLPVSPTLQDVRGVQNFSQRLESVSNVTLPVIRGECTNNINETNVAKSNIPSRMTTRSRSRKF